jgi:hypothetical protein
VLVHRRRGDRRGSVGCARRISTLRPFRQDRPPSRARSARQRERADLYGRPPQGRRAVRARRLRRPFSARRSFSFEFHQSPAILINPRRFSSISGGFSPIVGAYGHKGQDSQETPDSHTLDEPRHTLIFRIISLMRRPAFAFQRRHQLRRRANDENAPALSLTPKTATR